VEAAEMLMAGLDDAGRGAAIGPLAVAGVLIDEERYPKLLELRVKDSKLLTPEKRRELEVKIKKITLKHQVLLIAPAKVDYFVSRKPETGGLNRLEAYAMAEIIDLLRPDVAYVDASDISTERFKRYIAEKVGSKVKLVVEHKADSKYPIVSAASILAKVARDAAIEDLKRKYGDLGSGYMADPKTVRFLREYLIRKGGFPDFVRTSWKPIKRMLEASRNSTLDRF